ncbi:MAG: hypothetical protein BGO61_04535 [Thiobacillus sp. 65-69]|nr:hypothetical protein [Thiobacillus sp.]ODU89674.1 MAG: hypothetical protein ABT21_08205 [Thiobacillus sp. SCN 65-179]OJW37602.1 MAG: hypothetical protein BGO61_04535 [Thiobacillus sp. 65-69]
MPWAPFTPMLDAMGSVAIALWGLLFIVMLAGIALLLRTEKRQYERRGKGRSWLWMRILALPMLAISAAATMLPARAVSGMEALGLFYFGLLVVAPLAWFGLHLLAGRLQSPRLTRGESLGLAVSGLAVLLVPALLISSAQGPIHTVSYLAKIRAFDRTPESPLALTAQPVQLLRLGDSGVLYAQALTAPAGIRLARVEMRTGEHWHDTATLRYPLLCRDGNDLHLAWPEGMQPSPLRIHWQDSQGQPHQARFETGNMPAGTARHDFALRWREDGFDLPVPLARDLLQIGWHHPVDGALHYRSLDMLQPGETFADDCVKPGYRRVAWQQEGPVSGVILRFHPPLPAAPWQIEYRRDGAVLPDPVSPRPLSLHSESP